MGATVAAGVSQIDSKAGTDKDPSFVTVGYSIAGLNLGYALYDSDENGDETSMGVGTSVGGMDVGVQFASYDSTADTDYMRVSVNKGMVQCHSVLITSKLMQLAQLMTQISGN